MRRTLALALILNLIAAGCSRAAPPSPPAPVAAEQPQPQPEDPASAELLPRPDTPYSFMLSDGTTAEEYYMRDGNRLIGAADGKPYVTWFITHHGIWRQDPHGPGLLRYLPPVLQENAVWTQPGGGGLVWFHLRRQPDCRHPEGKIVLECWELTVLDRQERTTLRFGRGDGLLESISEHFANPAESYTRERRQPPRGAVAPEKEQLLAEGGRLPEGPLPAVSEATPEQFAAAVKSLAGAGNLITEVDLNADGRPERIEGRLEAWLSTSLHLFDADGREMDVPFFMRGEEEQHRVEVVRIPGMDRPALLYQHGRTEAWQLISLWWWRDRPVPTWGWHPKAFEAWGTGAGVEPDGTIIVTGSSANLAGYIINRKYRIQTQESDYMPYLVKQLSETAAPGPYPTAPDDLITAAFLAHWYGVRAELARYIPAPGVRGALEGGKVPVPPYVPPHVQVGKLSFQDGPQGMDPVPDIAPAAPGPDGSADFLLRIPQYEAYTYWAGHVTFGQEPDGRLVIRSLAVTKKGFVY